MKINPFGIIMLFILSGSSAFAAPPTATVYAQKSDFILYGIPESMLKSVRLSFKLDTDGRAKECESKNTTEQVVLASCKMLEDRLRLRPDVDEGGRLNSVRMTMLVLWKWPEGSSDFGGATPINIPNWITPYDYPPQARAKRQQGKVSVSLSISEFGTVKGCQITATSGYTVLDEKTCTLLSERGMFLAAVNDEGAPVATTGTTIGVWMN